MLIYFLMITIILLTSVAQVLLKIGSTQEKNSSYIKLFSNPASLLGYLTFAIVAFLSIYAIKELELKVFFAITSLTYVVVLLFSYFFLNEKLTSNKIIGVVLVTFGVILFNL